MKTLSTVLSVAATDRDNYWLCGALDQLRYDVLAAMIQINSYATVHVC